MDRAGGQEGAGQGRAEGHQGAGQGRGASGCRAGPGCIGCAKEGGGGCSLLSGVEGREQREAVGDPRLHQLRSRCVGGIRGDPHGFGDCFGNRVDTTSHWLESVTGRGVSTQHLLGWWSEQRGECAGWGALGMETLRSADSSGQLR